MDVVGNMNCAFEFRFLGDKGREDKSVYLFPFF